MNTNKGISIEIGTEKFKEAVNKAIKGAGRARLFMITDIVVLEGNGGDLLLKTTDRTNNLVVKLKDILPKDVSFTTNTNVETLQKLLNKTTSSTVVLTIEADRIIFSGNGEVNLTVLNETDGTPAIIEDIVVEGESKELKVKDLKNFLKYLRVTLPTNISEPWFTGYRVFDGKALTYNKFGANIIEIDWKDVDILLPTTIVNLFDTLSEEKVMVTISEEDTIKFETETVEITGSLQAGVENYVTKRFVDLMYNDMFSKVVTMDRIRLAEALDRISLFITSDEKYVFVAEIDGKSIMLLTQSKNFVEEVSFDTSENENIITRFIGIETFKAAVSATKSDKITLSFAENGGIRINEDNVYMLVPYARKG